MAREGSAPDIMTVTVAAQVIATAMRGVTAPITMIAMIGVMIASIVRGATMTDHMEGMIVRVTAIGIALITVHAALITVTGILTVHAMAMTATGRGVLMVIRKATGSARAGLAAASMMSVEATGVSAIAAGTMIQGVSIAQKEVTGVLDTASHATPIQGRTEGRSVLISAAAVPRSLTAMIRSW